MESNSKNSIEDLLIQTVSDDPNKAESLSKLLKLGTYQKHLQSLLNMSSQQIRHLIEEQEKEIETLQKQYEDISYQEYRAFISAHQICHGSFGPAESQAQVQQHLDTLRDKLGEVEQKLEKLQLSVGNDAGEREESASILPDTFKGEKRRLDKIFATLSETGDLLEIPLLLESCIVKRCFDEALDLLDHVNHLSARFGSIPFVQKFIIEKCTKSADRLVEILMQDLRTGGSLQSCIKTSSYLRRMKVFSEAEFRIVFLKSRASQFKNIRDIVSNSISESIESQAGDMSPTGKLPMSPTTLPNQEQKHQSAHAAKFIKHLLETSRSIMFEIITQYQAIFSDTLIPFSGNNYSSSTLIHSSTILSSFLNALLQEIIQIIRQKLDDLNDLSQLMNIHTQAMHFGVALSRKGFDMRLALGDLFETRALVIIQSSISSTFTALVDSLRNNLASWTATSANQHRSNSVSSSQPQQQQYHQAILEIIPLAHASNSLLIIFNSIRMFPALSLYIPTAQSLHAGMKSLRETILQLFETSTEEQQKQLKKIEKVFALYWLPFVYQNYFNGLFPGPESVLQFRHPEIFSFQKDLLSLTGIS